MAEGSEKFDVAAITHEVATAISMMREALAPIDEAVDGYRAQLEAKGRSPTAAETMALSMHGALMATITGGGR